MPHSCYFKEPERNVSGMKSTKISSAFGFWEEIHQLREVSCVMLIRSACVLFWKSLINAKQDTL